MKIVRQWWHAALKEATGASDDISAVTTAGEIRIGSVVDGAPCIDSSICGRWSLAIRQGDIDNLLVHADDDGYWVCPHEVRLELRSKVDRLAIHRDFAHGTTAARRAHLKPFIDAHLPDYVGLEMLADFKTASRRLPGLRRSRYDAVMFDDSYPVADIKVERRGLTRLAPSTVALLRRPRR